jgi:hypothetical protein
MNTINEYHVSPDDRISNLHQGWMQDVFGALLNGASLHPLNVQGIGLETIAPWMISERITILHMVPTLYRHLTATLGGGGDVPQPPLNRPDGGAGQQKRHRAVQKSFSVNMSLGEPAGEHRRFNHVFEFYGQ